MLHATAADRYRELKRKADRLERAMHKGDLSSFLVDAFHLVEWTRKDRSTSKPQRRAAAQLANDADLQIAKEIANNEKHFDFKPGGAVRSASTDEGYGVGRSGVGDYGVGEQSVIIHFSDGTQRNALELVRSLVKKWAAVGL